MSGSIRKFIRDRRGAFAMQFALMAVPLCVCTGLAIDGGRAFLAHYELASALDAAALAAGSTLDEDADLDAVARRFVDMNFTTQHDDPIELELVEDEDVLTLTGSVRINTFFMPLVGQPHVEVHAESEVRRGGNNVEVALALDVTGSMNATRIQGLKDASKALIDEVVSAVQTPYFSKIAIAPWSQSVHVDDVHAPSTALDELRGELVGPTNITAATWRKASTSTQTISSAGWRTNTGKAITNATWRNGSALTITGIAKTNSNTRIRITTSGAHGYANGDSVYISGANGSFTGLNGNTYKVANRTTGSPGTFWLQNVGTTTYTTPPSGTTAGTAGSSQRCLYTDCVMRITSSSHGFATGDLIYINGVTTSGGGSSVNNTWGTTWTITQRDANNFTLNGTVGPTFANYSSSGTASECYVSDCRYRVITTAAHSLSNTDPVYIWGVTESGGGTSIETAINSSRTVENPSGSTFYLSGQGRDYKDWTSGGSVAACAHSTCNIAVTSPSHGLATGERVLVSGVGGLTGINNSSPMSWEIIRDSSNIYRIKDSNPEMSNVSSAYTSGGTSQCLVYGCSKYRFFTNGGSERIFNASNCIVERYGADKYTDVSTATSPLGILYTSDGSCSDVNYVTPLTPNKTRLNAAIDDLEVGGSTAGQLGIAWAWHMLSPNFASVWDKEAVNQPLAYGTSELAKVAVLMTDGEFNHATCNGVPSNSWGSGTRINCNPADNPFDQAAAICTAMKAQGIVIYTVGLELNTALQGDDFLLACATSPEHAFLAADINELEEAFKDIATSISKLRLSR